MIRKFQRWLLRRRMRTTEIHLPGVKIQLQADNNSTVAYHIGNVELRRRADDE